MSWRRTAPLLIDGLAWGVEPLALVEALAAFEVHAPIARRLADRLRAGMPLADALRQLRAPRALVEAAQVGTQLNAHAAAGLGARIAEDGQQVARVMVLGGLGLPLLTLLIASSTLANSRRIWAAVPGITLPGWIIPAAWGALVLSLVIVATVALPRLRVRLARIRGLGWIGARRRAARWADVLALTAARDGSLPDALTALGAEGVARQISAGTPLPDALGRHATGRHLAPALRGLPPTQWPRALTDQARRLVMRADRNAERWAIALRTGGTLLAAVIIGAWLLAFYTGLFALPTSTGAP